MNEESLFSAALEWPMSAERRAFLERACEGDDALRQRLEHLLSAHLKTLGILDHSSRRSLWTEGPGGTRARESPPLEQAGTVIAGRYTLLEEVGDGGMGTVWKAEQTQPVRRIVALKLIKAGMDTRTVLSRFEAERQALALMEHPNIARVLDGGTTDSGRPYFVMEFVPGVPITEFCDEEHMSVAERLDLFLQVCRAVQHAHTKGVIHRDLKPGNILVSRLDPTAPGVPKVIDFGLAKAMQEPLTEVSRLTLHGVLLGTPLYMSPEQADSNNLDIDARTDIFALGVILYELLTGTTPLERDRFQELSWQELLRLIKEGDPPRPSARVSASDALADLAARRRLEPSRLRRLVRGELDWIVMKCLEKDRSRRYETVCVLARDVERYLMDEPVEACPPSVSYRLGKFVRRNKGVMLATTIGFLLLVSGVAGTSLGLIRADRATQAATNRAEGERKASEQAQKRLSQVQKGNEILASIFRDLDPCAEEKEGKPLRVILGERLDQAAANLDGDTVGDHLVVADLQLRLGRTYRALGQASKAKDLFAKAGSIRRDMLGAEDPETLATLFEEAQALCDLGKLSEAISLGQQVRDAQERILGADHEATLATKNSLAVALWTAGKWSEAATLLEQLRDTLVSRLGPDHSQTLAAIDNLSGVYTGLGKGALSIELAKQVREARLKRYGPDHPLSIASLNNLAFRYSANGKMRQALALFEEARDAVVPKLGVDNPKTLIILDNLARMYRAFGRTSEAIPLAEQVRDGRMRILGPYHHATIHTLLNLGLCYQAGGQPAKAFSLFQQAADGLERLGFDHEDAGMIIENLCDVLEAKGQASRADGWRRNWLAAVKWREGADSIKYAHVLKYQGGNMLESGRHADAERLFRESLAIRQKAQPSDWSTYHAQSLLGEALLGQAKNTEAEPLLIQAYEGLRAREREIPSLLARQYLAEAGGRVVRVYEALRRPLQAAQWRAKLPWSEHPRS
jgi:serine/threonine protein kinase/tetratricopeptide (TPR) repeat protein